MGSSHRFTLAIVLVAFLCSTINAQDKLDLNDVSWLWPVPTKKDDLSRIISMGDLKSKDGEDVWLDAQFDDLVEAVDTGLTKVGDDEVDFADAIKDKSVWKIAGMRVDPSAPGPNEKVREAFGSQTQIRLIVQPVTDGPADNVTVHDVAVHLVFQWTKGKDDKKRDIPDNDKFKAVLADLDVIKAKTEAGGASTKGQPLGIHPGLLANVDGLDAQVRDFFEKHLSNKNLDSMALMGIQSGVEPWFFFATKRFPDGHFRKIPVPGMAASEPQMIDFRRGPDKAKVVPTPLVNNLAPITATPMMRPSADTLRGVATSALFDFPLPDMDAFAVIGKDGTDDVLHSEVRNKDIADVVASPIHSHFFNTDCVSCHTETRRRMNLGLTQGKFAFKPDGKPPAIVDDQLPKHDWNVRNFGWFPPSRFIGGGRTVATATQRTANETFEVVEFIERNFRSDHND